MKQTLSLTVILVLFFANTYCSFGQQSDLPKIIPPSPTAASLGKFGEIPVGYYTGTPNISIPIYEIKSGSLTLPITLSYDATGVRVAQDASWVGLGWSLSAGGLVTRIVRGGDDFSGNNGYHYSGKIPANLTYKCMYEDDLYNGHISVEQFLTLCPTTPQIELNKMYALAVAQGSMDGEPDIFSYNLGGQSGKFMIDKDTNGSTIFGSQRNSVDIKFGLFGEFFLITTPDGTEYYFGTKEVVTNRSRTIGELDRTTLAGLATFNSASSAANSSWYLDRITSRSGDTINFFYEKGQSLSLISTNATIYSRLPGSFGSLQPQYKYTSNSRQNIEDVLLKKIEFSGGRVEFETTNRDDIEAVPNSGKIPQKLSRIKVFNNASAIPLKDIILGHTYFEPYNPNGVNHYYDKRLKLDFVQFDQPSNRYSFLYANPGNLPNKYSHQIDEWGFYTTYFDNPLKYTSNFWYPELFPSAVYENLIFEGAPPQRTDPTASYSGIGNLISITYPTKGRTDFEYEPHDFENGAFVSTRMSKIATLDFSDPDPNNHISTPEDAFETITLTSRTTVSFTAVSSHNTSDPFHIGYLRSISGQLLHTFYPDNIQTGPYKTSRYSVELEPGQYVIEAKEITGQMTKIEAVYYERNTFLMKGCGIRVKSIKNYDSSNILVGKKSFEYLLEGTSFSSGLQLKRAKNSYIKGVNNGTAPPYSSATFLVRSFSSLFPDGFYSPPNVVGYSRVVVKDGISGSNGSTIYNYYNQDKLSAGSDKDNFPGNPELYDTRCGQLLSKVVVNNSGELLQKTEYEYSLKEIDSLQGLQVFQAPFDYENTFGGDDVNYYENISEWWVQTKQTETNYFNNSAQPVIVVQNDKYENALHKQITSREVTQSDHTVKVTTYKYPHDFVGQQPYTDMVNVKHLWSPVIEETNYKNGVSSGNLLSRSKTTYSFWNNQQPVVSATNQIYPLNIQTESAGTVLEPRISYHSYDARGNVLSVSKAFGPAISYVWGYSKQYPVAEVKGAFSNEVYHWNFEEAGDYGPGVVRDNSRSHTGLYSGKISNGGPGEQVYHSSTNLSINQNGHSRKYRYSGWIYSTGPSAELFLFMKRPGETGYFSYVDAVGTNETNKWVYMVKDFEVPADVTQLNLRIDNNGAGDVWFDDLAIYPSESQMTTYTYKPLVGMTSMTDAKGQVTTYEYDSFQRLKTVRDQSGKVLKNTDYHYQNQ